MCGALMKRYRALFLIPVNGFSQIEKLLNAKILFSPDLEHKTTKVARQ